MQAPKVHLKHNVIKPKSLHESEIESLNVTMIEDTSFDKSLPGTPKLISLVVHQKHVSMHNDIGMFGISPTKTDQDADIINTRN